MSDLQTGFRLRNCEDGTALGQLYFLNDLLTGHAIPSIMISKVNEYKKIYDTHLACFDFDTVVFLEYNLCSFTKFDAQIVNYDIEFKKWPY